MSDEKPLAQSSGKALLFDALAGLFHIVRDADEFELERGCIEDAERGPRVAVARLSDTPDVDQESMSRPDAKYPKAVGYDCRYVCMPQETNV